MMTFGSLFAGIGGIDLGLERAGLRCLWQVEGDSYARRVLAKHWPHVPRYIDVHACGPWNLAPVDLIAGGFPCQEISNAGARAGIDGARSGLWGQFARLVRALGPGLVLVENVAALRGRGLDRVLGDLAACGYDAAWDCLPACAVGAPHRRDRIFVVAWRLADAASQRRPHGPGDALRSGVSAEQPSGCGGGLADADRVRRDQGSRGIEEEAGCAVADDRGQEMADADGGRRAQLGEAHDDDGRHALGDLFGGRRPGGEWPPEPPVGRVVDGLPGRVDRLRCLGNAVVPAVAEHVGNLILASFGGGR